MSDGLSVFGSLQGGPPLQARSIRTYIGVLACIKKNSGLQNSVPKNRQTWHLFVGHSEAPPECCADAPEWIGSQLAILEAYNRRNEVIEALLTTAPTTLAGALDLLDYVGSPEFADHPDSDPLMKSIYENYYAEEFLSDLAATMRRLIGEQS
jgi:hypothetical protein